MSQWFYILGTITVDLFDSDSTAYNEYWLKDSIEHCPDIAGSEGGIDIFINHPSDLTVSCSHDDAGICCRSRGYNILNQNRFSVGNPRCYPYFHMKEVNTKYIITLSGGLRDVTFNEGIRQLQKFLNRLSKQVWFENLCIQVSNGWDRSYVIQNREWYSDNYEG